jgi:hypothetical protein
MARLIEVRRVRACRYLLRQSRLLKISTHDGVHIHHSTYCLEALVDHEYVLEVVHLVAALASFSQVRENVVVDLQVSKRV